MPNGTAFEMASEVILRLAVGEPAPAGHEILRVIGHVQEPVGTGANYRDVYVVAARRAGAGS